MDLVNLTPINGFEISSGDVNCATFYLDKYDNDVINMIHIFSKRTIPNHWEARKELRLNEVRL